MAVAIAITPASPRARVDACRVNVTGASANDAADYDTDQYPTRAELRQYLAFLDPDGVEVGRSYVFTPGADGTHEFNSYVWPEDAIGAASIKLHRADTDAVLATQAVTVTDPDA